MEDDKREQLREELREDLRKLRERALAEIAASGLLDELESLRLKYTGKKGELTQVLRNMGSLSAEERPVMGKLANEIRDRLE
ncbi:MAG: hypothetical protein FWH49_01635, partial [Clostridiales bacterium]|nr:hypothetical protein [Clostridiales bacterium]